MNFITVIYVWNTCEYSRGNGSVILVQSSPNIEEKGIRMIHHTGGFKCTLCNIAKSNHIYYNCRGHPLCEFCDTRYMDGDDLFRHLRREHLFCHFCDADGLHQYYSSYEFLRQHFQVEHYLCEEGECINEKFTSVFRTDIDMKGIVHF